MVNLSNPPSSFHTTDAKAFRVFNIRRQEVEENFHITFNESDEVNKHTSTEADDINFNENSFFPEDEFCVPRNPINPHERFNEGIPYVPAFNPLSKNNITRILATTEPKTISPSFESPNSPAVDHQNIINQSDEPFPTESLVKYDTPDLTIFTNNVNPDTASPPLVLVINLNAPALQDKWSRD
ncbi:hypothetical protein Tco_0758326 [Tanacetum coccineum]